MDTSNIYSTLLVNNTKEKMNTILLWSILYLVNANAQSISLDGIWTGTIPSSSHSFSAVVPGGIYTDLAMSNLIPQNLIGMNDIENRWVGNQSVNFQKIFSVNSTFLRAPKIVMVFHGVDTFSTIFLNNHKIGETSNMFLRYNFDVKEYLKEGENTLNVLFNSSVKVAEELYNDQSRKYIVPPICVPEQYNGECHVNHIRKMQASFAWDWGPAFPSSGIWKSVELIPIHDFFLLEVTSDVQKTSNSWKINVTIFYELPVNEMNITLECIVASTLSIDQSKNISENKYIMLSSDQRFGNITMTLDVPSNLIEEWWPNGYGKQKLYPLRITMSTLYSIKHKDLRIGFRTVELIQEPLKGGLSFYFRINGAAIFAKGSNFIPSSVFPELTAEENTIRHLLMSVKDTHMNMLRVWGGGVYESELFYNLADEFGIMIWQDFMFACAMYPTTEEFLSLVREEVVQNVKRLKNHPSIVLWAGNNENEAALYGNWYGTGTAEIYKKDYVKLYVDVIKKEVEQLDSTRPFVVSSPSNGLYTEENNFIGPNPYSNFYGDVHYYNYLKNGWDINQYPRVRFSSEYGFQSLPSLYTMMTASESLVDLQINSTFMKYRQHLLAGNSIMKYLISKNLLVPETGNSLQDFADFIYLSQINQAVSVKIQSEFYRQSMSTLNEIGEGMTMGALYWQLNDVWQAPSWSSIEFGGRWKMLHYYASKFFAPIIITSHISPANELSLYVVSDNLYTIQNTTAKLNIYNWNSMKPVKTVAFENITVKSAAAGLVATLWLDEFLVQVGCGDIKNAKKHCVISLSLIDENGLQLAPVNYIYPTALKNVNLRCVNITVKVKSTIIPGKMANYPDFEIELTTNGIALFVWIEVGNLRGRFSENGFHMFEQKKRLFFYSYEAIAVEDLQNNIKVIDLCNIYHPNRTSDINDFIN